MSTSSNLDRICVAALALAVLIAALAFCAPALGYEAASGGVVLGYEERLFDTSVVHTIDIVMDDWEGFIAGCEDEEYVLCDLVIDGEDWGLYLAVEGVEESFLLRNYGTDYGELYKPDSMEICFIKDGDFAAWIEARGRAPGSGALIYKGERVGTHGGCHRYTLGQRRGLGFAAGKRVFVSEIRPEANEVVLSDGDGLHMTHITTGEANWLITPPRYEFRCRVRVRHSHSLADATALAMPDGTLDITFDAPVRAPCPGQAAALYSGEMLIAGGIIK